MEALQYIYTSWKNGDSTEKGYMIYSRSEGISESECTAIKDAMQYLAPKELTLTPTPQEIADNFSLCVFPISFSQQVVVVLHNQLTSEKTTLADTEITLFMR